jgi:PAS domain S-box-containing protein
MNLLRLVHPVIGHSAPEWVGSSVLSFIHPDDAASLSAAFAQLLTTQKQTVVCECRASDTDSHWRWLEIQMTDLLDDPDVSAILFNYRDITERKGFKEMSQRLAAYLACSDYAMFTQDPSGTILDWSDGAERAFGYSASQIVGQNVSLLIPPDLLDREAVARAAVIQGEPVPQYGATRIRRDGKRISVLVSLSAACSGDQRTIAQICRLDPTTDSSPTPISR